jgi:hypothetical protein
VVEHAAPGAAHAARSASCRRHTQHDLAAWNSSRRFGTAPRCRTELRRLDIDFPRGLLGRDRGGDSEQAVAVLRGDDVGIDRLRERDCAKQLPELELTDVHDAFLLRVRVLRVGPDQAWSPASPGCRDRVARLQPARPRQRTARLVDTAQSLASRVSRSHISRSARSRRRCRRSGQARQNT